jgi:broad specificity phosphatase PhoE
MSFLLVAPDALESAAADMARIGTAVSSGHLAAAIPTTEIAAAGADEVSAAVAALFGAHAAEYQAAAAQAAIYYDRFVSTLSAAATSYAGAEAAIAPSLRGTAGQAGGDGATGKPIVIDFVRHGQSVDNAANLIDTAVPGTGLTPLGQQQALSVAKVLAPQGPFAGIYTSQLLRTQQTAAPLAGMLGMNTQALPGLNEIDAGIFNHWPEVSVGGVLYLVAPVAWTLGFPIVPMLAPGSAHINGVVFDQGFTSALQTMYANSAASPIVASNGKVTDVAFSSEFAIEVGTLMNVNNPDPLLMLTHPLSNGGVVVVQGDPQDGWTLVSWDGMPVPPATLPTKLFVDARNLITAPQFAGWDAWETVRTGDPTTIFNAVEDGAVQVGAATVHFPLAVTRDLVDAVRGTSLSGLSTELTNLLP